jgi:hypothetical protein
MIIAAPVVRKPLSSIGSPGATDFVSIFLAEELNADEYRTTLRHEQAHIWARHNMRYNPSFNKKEWIIACEMEIARNIYSERDISTIIAPRSRLRGGFLPDTYENMPSNLLIAEEIYDWLIENPQENPQENNNQPCVLQIEQGIEPTSEELTIEEVRRELDKAESTEKSAEAAKTAYLGILYRPPSLISEVDSALRIRTNYERSYRRPSRRNLAKENVILKGSVNTPRPPLVEIFVDRSGSFSPDKTQVAENYLSKILGRYGVSIKHDVWFFGDGKLTANDNHFGGNTPYRLIAEHLLCSTPKIAIIITDDDPCEDLPSIPKYVKVLCLPVGAKYTQLSTKIGGRDVAVIT